MGEHSMAMEEERHGWIFVRECAAPSVSTIAKAIKANKTVFLTATCSAFWGASLPSLQCNAWIILPSAEQRIRQMANFLDRMGIFLGRMDILRHNREWMQRTYGEPCRLRARPRQSRLFTAAME